MLLKAVAYARYSSNNQREESIDAQFRAIREYAVKNKITIINTYQDEAVSGKTTLRDDFQTMISAITKKELVVDLILVHKFSRFARNKYDSAINKKKLKNIGVSVVSVTQSIDDTPEGAMLETIIEAMDEYYSANLTLEVQKGLKENALKAQHTGGLVPLGFALDENRKYIPNESAKIVKQIFIDYANGTPITKIVNNLTANGIYNQKNKPFAMRTIYDMLRNEKYIGHYNYTLKGVQKIRLENVIEPIIDMELWHTVKKRLEAQKPRVSPRAKRVYFLTGKMFCGVCGASISGAGSKKPKNSDKYFYYYKCIGKVKLKNGCDNSSLNKEWIENAVLQNVLNTVMDEKTVREIARLAAEKLEEKPTISTEELQAKLYDTLEELKRLAKLYLSGKIQDNILNAESDLLNARKYELETEINQRKSVENSSIYTEQYLYDFFQVFINDKIHENTLDSDDFKHNIINTFVEKVVVLRQEITVFIRPNFTKNNMGASVQFAGAVRTLSPIRYPVKIARKKSLFGRNE